MTKKFNVVSRGDILSDGLSHAMSTKLESVGWEKSSTPEIVLSVGGDGTMLHAFHQYKELINNVSFVALHTGHLGFYTDWNQSEFEKLLDCLINENPYIVNYPLVEMEINEEEYLALNEVYIKSPKKSLISSVYINGDHFENFRGDGLCISTPSGSTAYNKALNGAIIHPSLEAIQLSEMASINNNVFRTIGSSIILPNHHSMEIFVEQNDDLVIGTDHLIVKPEEFKSIKLKVSDKKIKFARYKKHTFWNRVKESFI